MSRELPDRRNRFFGREEDVTALMARATKPGLTAVVGRPQIGKSWFLNEVARRVAEDSQYLVGHAESMEGEPDLPLRAIVDLYARWLEGAGYTEQAAMVWDQQRRNLLTALASAVGTMGKAVADVALKPFAIAAKETLDGLVAVDEKLKTGGVQLPILQHDQAHELLRAVHGVSQRPLVLVLDQWEKSRRVGEAAKLLDAFIRHIEDWPPCHIVLGLRSESEREDERRALPEAEGLIALRPGKAKLHRLGEMRLDEVEKHRLATWVRSTVPAAAGESDSTLLGEVSGFPGVLRRWDDERDEMKDRSDLERLAADAHRYRYQELEARLAGLDNDARRLAIRLVLLPQGGGELWPAIRGEVLAGIDAAVLDDLCQSKVLEGQDPPTFGHGKRFDAARAWLFKHRRSTCRGEAERLILAFGARVRSTDEEARPFSSALREQVNLALELGASDLAQAVCLANATLFRDNVPLGALDRSSELTLGPNGGGVAPLLAKGLLNTLNHAKAEDDLARRDALLDELRALAKDHPDDAPVRENLARGLFNTLNHAKAENELARRDALLDELRALAKDHPDDAPVREILARGLFNTLADAKDEDDLARRDALLDELRALAEAHPDDAPVRERLAKGLFNTLVHAKDEDDLKRRDALLDELRALAREHPADAPVRERLAMGLFNTLVDAKDEDDLARRDDLLDGLRALAREHPDDAPVRERLAMGLAKTMLDMEEEGGAERTASLKRDLLGLAERWPDDGWVMQFRDSGLI